jgi:hypothetical protein
MMDTYIPNVITSLKNNTRMSVYNVLKNVKSDKTQITSLISTVADFQSGNKYNPSLPQRFSILNRELVIDSFRDADLRMKQYYSVANTVGLIINSMIDIFFSEIEKVEKDLDVLQNFIDNYEYVSGKDDLYNSNYIEKFDNFLSDYRSDGASFPIYDKDGSIFPVNGNGFVDQKTGVFKIGEGVYINNVLNNINDFFVKTNYELTDYSDTGFSAVLTETRQDSWSVSVKSPTIITTNLKEVTQYCNYDTSNIKGAQAYVEVNFSTPQEIDTIYVTPNYGNGLQLLQIVVFSDDDIVTIPVIENPDLTTSVIRTSENNLVKPVLSAPVLIDSIKDISFEKTLCKKVLMIFNQPVYKRTQNTSDVSEISSRAVYNVAKNIRNQRRINTDKLQDLIYSIFYQNQNLKDPKKNKKLINNYYSYRYPCIENVPHNSYMNNVTKDDLIEAGLYDNSEYSLIGSIFKNFFSQAFDSDNEIFEQNIYMENSRSAQNTYNFRSPGFVPINGSNLFGHTKHQYIEPMAAGKDRQSALIDLLNVEQKDQYEYSFSLKAIEFAATQKQASDKACFVSKKIPFNGHPLAIKARINSGPNDIDLNNYTYDLKSPSSVELYFSNIENPLSENDWISILPDGQTQVESEVLFFDNQNFAATTRFDFVENTISIFKDGFVLNPSVYSISGLNRIELEQFDPSSTYVASYTVDNVSYSYDVIDYVKSGLLSESTKYPADNDGIGETFSSTDLSKKITLENMPYINSEAVESATYSSSIGTVFSGNYSSYSPVKVVLNDGSIAINLTNYTTTNNNSIFPDLDNYYFIQNGKNIIFNKTISSPFKVIYEYLPNTIRFKLIVRNNIPNVQYTSSIDSVLVKAKTKVYDPNYDKLTKVSLTN